MRPGSKSVSQSIMKYRPSPNTLTQWTKTLGSPGRILLEHKFGVIGPLQNYAFPLRQKEKKRNTHIKKALKTCSYPNCASIKLVKMHREEYQTSTRENRKTDRTTLSSLMWQTWKDYL